MEEWDNRLIMDKLIQVCDNKFCFDCGVESPSWASVNNAIFLCANCANLHRGLGVKISFVKSISIDEWQESQVKLLYYGGNASLQEFVNAYSLEKGVGIYRTKALDYYREVIKARAEDKEAPQGAPSIETGKELIEQQAIGTDNLTFQQMVDKIWNNAKEYGKNIGDKLKDLTFDDVRVKSREFLEDFTEKVKNYNYKEKFAEIKIKGEEIYLNIKESTKQTMENPRGAILEKYENSKVVVADSYEKSKAKVIRTLESSKEVIIENYQHSVGRIQESQIVQRAKRMLTK